MENKLKYNKEIEAIKNDILLPLAEKEVVLMNVSSLDRCIEHAYQSKNDTIVDLVVGVANARPFSDFNKRISLNILKSFYKFDDDFLEMVMNNIDILTNNEFEDENERNNFVKNMEMDIEAFRIRKTPEMVIYYTYD